MTDTDLKLERAKEMLRRAETRARNLSLPFDITLDDVVALCLDNCPVLGIPLDYSHWRSRKGQGRKGNVPCIDRQIPSLGYKKSNVWVISCAANASKGSHEFAGPDEVRAYVLTEKEVPAKWCRRK